MSRIVEVGRCRRCNGGGEMDCPDCNGSGYDFGDGGQCDRCGGTGDVTCSRCGGGGGEVWG